jgi:hypothetical protein
MERRIGDTVHVAQDARGERTGPRVRGWMGTVVDRRDYDEGGLHYFLRFDVPGRTVFFDWLPADSLLDD